MQHLYYVRHGESQAQAENNWANSQSPLSAEGIRQAEAEGLQAKQEKLSFDLIITSPYVRTRETAKIIARAVGYPLEKIVTSDLFTERFFGIMEGTPVAEFFEAHEYREIDKVEGAETIKELQDRATVALKYLRQLPESSILVVGHGAFGRALRRVINGQPWTDEYDKPLDRLTNARIMKLI